MTGMRTYRIAVTGGRDHAITKKEAGDFFHIIIPREHPVRRKTSRRIIILHGNCRGVDQRAAELAESWGYPAVPFEAPWDPLKKLLGEENSRWKAAGHLRNWQLLHAADLLVAFPGGRGTADCVRQARELGVEVVEIGC